MTQILDGHILHTYRCMHNVVMTKPRIGSRLLVPIKADPTNKVAPPAITPMPLTEKMEAF